MRHDIKLDGYAFRLRPVRLDDAAFILSLRTDPDLSRYINPTSPRLEDQERWMQQYFQRPTDFYWVVERIQTGESEGAVAIYDLDQSAGQAEWGRWILRRGSLAAVESALLVYRAAFEVLGLSRIYCRTLSANSRVVSFHAACGLTNRPDPGLRVTLRGENHRVVEQFLTEDRWESVRQSLERRACDVAHLLRR